MDAGGGNIRPLSAFENFEWAPSVANDGRILYTRWDYIDRFNGHFFSLWSANQDGTNPQLVYGNYTVKPQVKFEARAIPDSSKLVFTAVAHHSICGGTLCLLDRDRGTEEAAPLTRLTPEVAFPETEANGGHYYANPWPLSEEYFLVGWADQKLPPHCRTTDEQNPRNAMGLYVLDAFGNLELLYRDPEISSVSPMPVKPRPQPPTHPTLAASNDKQESQVLVQDVYYGLDGVPRGSVKQLRLVAVVPKVQPQMNNPVLGISAEDPGKFVLGTVPVESDGSAYFRVPSGLPLFFQALDASGAAVQTMRTLTYAMPGQTLACAGCHEHRDAAPPVGKSALAALRPPSKPTPGPSGSWPLRFDQLVQPMLDRHCLECHRAGGKDVQAAKLDLASTNAYQALLAFGDADLKKQAFERDRSNPNQAVAANSKLWKLLTQPGGHQKVKLDADSLDRLATWMDTYAQRLGSFSEQQERELLAFRRTLSPLLSETPDSHQP
jgi:Hydrazine synthase alpha subunit middle domain